MRTVIRGGTVVAPDGPVNADLVIEGELIVEVIPRRFEGQPSPPWPGALEIDATDLLVVPGGVDPHIHSAWDIPGSRDEHDESAGPEHVGQVALAGGTTTWIDFAPQLPGQTLIDSIHRRSDRWRGNCASDYAFHVMLAGSLSQATLSELPGIIEGGFPSVKIFTTDITPSRKGRKVPLGDIQEVLRATAQVGGTVAFHAEEDDLVMHMHDRLTREGDDAFGRMPEVHSRVSEDIAFHKVITLSSYVPDSAIYMMHVSSAEGVAAIREAQERGQNVVGETLHQYALFTSEMYSRPNGQIFHTFPSLRDTSDNDALWEGMSSGAIATVGTDGICTPLELKLRGDRVGNITGGNVGVQPRMAIMYSECVRRGFSLMHFVDLTSANAARIFGMYPSKGALAVGSDADVVLIDPQQRRTIRAADLMESDYTPWEGWEVLGWPVRTLLRGRTVALDGEFCGSNTDGRLVSRVTRS